MAKTEERRRSLLELHWELEKLKRQGWSDEEIFAVANARTQRTRGRRRLADEEPVARIAAGRATAAKIAAGNDSVRRRLSGKSREALLLDRYHAQIKDLARVFRSIDISSLQSKYASDFSDWSIFRDIVDDVIRVWDEEGARMRTDFEQQAKNLGEDEALQWCEKLNGIVEKELFLWNRFLNPRGRRKKVTKETMAMLEQVLCELRAAAGEKQNPILSGNN